MSYNNNKSKQTDKALFPSVAIGLGFIVLLMGKWNLQNIMDFLSTYA